MQNALQPQYSRSVLEETPGRALTFLRGVGTSGLIRATLAAKGYTQAEHERGWTLLRKASGYTSPVVLVTDVRITAAINELDAWDGPNFRRIHAALVRLHPEQAAFVFGDGLQSSNGAGSVLTVRTLLDRFDQLESSPEREATRAADRAALETLAERGYTAEERRRLRQLVALAEQGTEVSPDAIQAASGQLPEETEHLADLTALRLWYDDWATTARDVIKRRDLRIRLGLAQRRRSATEEMDEVPASGAERPAE